MRKTNFTRKQLWYDCGPQCHYKEYVGDSDLKMYVYLKWSVLKTGMFGIPGKSWAAGKPLLQSRSERIRWGRWRPPGRRRSPPRSPSTWRARRGGGRGSRPTPRSGGAWLHPSTNQSSVPRGWTNPGSPVRARMPRTMQTSAAAHTQGREAGRQRGVAGLRCSVTQLTVSPSRVSPPTWGGQHYDEEE